MGRIPLALLPLGAACALLAAGAVAGAATTELVSRQSQTAGAAGGDDDSEAADISAGGRFVAFQTDAGNLGGSPADVVNIYVYDRVDQDVEMVSRQSAAAGGDAADDSSTSPSISANGRYVAFHTFADNLGGGAEDAFFGNVYVYDRALDKVELVSRRSKSRGGAGANSGGVEPSISARGRHVAFETESTNLGGPDGSGADVYVYDRALKEVELVSHQSQAAGGEGGDADSEAPSINADGSVVAFESQASNLGGPLEQTTDNIYVYDREANRLELVSRRSNGGAGTDGESHTPSISSDGSLVAFETDGDNLGGPIAEPSSRNIYVYNRASDRVSLVSRQSQSAGGDGADGFSFNADLSADGTSVAYETTSDNLGGPLDTDVNNVYVYERDRDRATLVSRQSSVDGGDGADAASNAPAINRDGTVTAFETEANNLGGAINTAVSNVYVHQR